MPLTDEALAEAGTQLADVLKQRELTKVALAAGLPRC